MDGAASAKPIIATETSNTSILVNDRTGFLFKSEDVNDLATKIVRLLKDDKLREEMGQAALEKARECDWDSLAVRMLDIYEAVAADFHRAKRKEGI